MYLLAFFRIPEPPLRISEPAISPTGSPVDRTIWPLTIGFVAGAGIAGFLLFEYLGAQAATTHTLLATLLGGLSGAVVAWTFRGKPVG